MLARKSVQIIREVKGPSSTVMISAFTNLVKVLFAKEDFTDETKSLLEEFLSDALRYQGKDGIATGHAIFFLQAVII
jgi:hypothetical protein